MIRTAAKWIFNFVLLLAVSGLTVYYIFRGHSLEQIFSYLDDGDLRYWLLGVLFVAAFMAAESVCIRILTRAAGYHPKFSHCLIYSFSGFFFSGITPFAGGGQPVQVYLMRRDEIPIAVSAPTLMVVTVFYKTVLVVMTLPVLLLRPAGIMRYVAPVEGWCWVGLGLTVACLIGWALLVFHPAAVRRFLLWLIRVGKRLLPFARRWLAEREILLDGWMDQYAQAADGFRRDRKAMLAVFGVTLAQRILLFSVTALACFSFGLFPENFWVLPLLQAMISLAVDMLPLPGGTGLTEALFLVMFSPICGEELTLPVMIVSRGISYYSQLLLGAAVALIAFRVIRKRRSVNNDRIL